MITCDFPFAFDQYSSFLSIFFIIDHPKQVKNQAHNQADMPDPAPSDTLKLIGEKDLWPNRTVILLRRLSISNDTIEFDTKVGKIFTLVDQIRFVRMNLSTTVFLGSGTSAFGPFRSYQAWP